MNVVEDQMKARRELDADSIESAYAHLATSVMGSKGLPLSLDDADKADSAANAILAYYKIEPVAVPDSVTDPSDRIDYVMRPAGVMHRFVKLEGTWWKDAMGAYITLLQDNTPVALLPDGASGYAYTDPSTGKSIRINKKTAANIQEDAICTYRPLPQRELTISDVITFMWRSLERWDYIQIILTTLVSTLIGLLPAAMMKILFSSIIPSGMFSLIMPIAVVLVGMTLSRSLISVTSSIITTRIQSKLQTQIEAATYSRVLLLPATFFNDYASGDLSSRISSMTSIVKTLSQIIISGGLTSIFSLMYVGQVLTYAPQLTLPALAIVILEVAASAWVTFATMKYDRKKMTAKSKVNGLTPSLLHGIQKIKLAAAERRAFAQWANAYADVSDATYNRPKYLISSSALITLISSAGTVLIYFLAATTHVSVSDYMAFNSAFGSVSGAIAALASSATTLATMRPLLEMVEPIMQTVPETLSDQQQVTNITGALNVDHLSFKYEDASSPVLTDVSFQVEPGEYVAIVGRTGCGKTTLLRLMLGFLNPARGAIYYDRYDVSTVDIRSPRKNIGVVLQNGSLFSGSIYTNITIASPRSTIDDAWEAAELAGIADDIRKMPMGMQTQISEGSGGISGGQKQRIMIARAVCGKPKILMLDEATSALDNVTQKHVTDALAGLDCTRIAIAHRLSTIRDADRVIMLENGVIVEDGTYDELVAADGAFADLVKRQQLEGE